jgi:opacity protein-like surface antigen
MRSNQEVMSFKKLFVLAVIVILFGISAWAQESKYEVTVQGSGFFPKQTTKGAVTSKPMSSGGLMTGVRVNLSNRFAFEGDYDYFRNDAKYVVNRGLNRVPMNVHGVTGTGIMRLPAFRNLRPFALAGGGLMMFDPRKTSAINTQTRGTFVYGGGADIPVIKHVALRAQYRGFVYKVPDFDNSKFKADKFSHAAVPSAGLVLTF